MRNEHVHHPRAFLRVNPVTEGKVFKSRVHEGILHLLGREAAFVNDDMRGRF